MSPDPARPHGRRRILIIAEAANPEWVSVPLVGWSLARAVAAREDVHLVTQVRNREAILRAGLVEGRDFTAIDNEALARPVWALGERLRGGAGKGWTLQQALFALSYPYFERLVWRQFRARLEAGAFDLVHRVTPLSPTAPSLLARKCAALGVPFLLGPLNGGVPWPKEWADARRAEKEWLAPLRAAYKLLPGLKRTYAKASGILAGSHHTASEIPASAQSKVIWLPENGIDPDRFPPASLPPQDGPLRAVFIGRLVPYKGPDMLIEAAAPLIAAGRLQVDLIGDGPMRGELEAQAAALGLTAPGLAFRGWLPHGEVAGAAGAAHLLAFPSIREFGGGVVLEAMAMGLVPLIVDYAGPGELLREGLGIKLPLGSRAAITASLRAALEQATGQRAEVAAMGAAARAHVLAHHSWAARATSVCQVYDWLLGTGPRPDFALEIAA